MRNYPKIGIRPTIDGRQGGVRESLEEKTMSLAKAVAKLISTNLKNGNGSPIECVVADSTIGRVAESAAYAGKFEREGVGVTITVTSCWCYGAETMDMNPYWPKAVWGFNGTFGCSISGSSVGWPCSKRPARIWNLWPRCAGLGREFHSGRRGGETSAFCPCSTGSGHHERQILSFYGQRFHGHCRLHCQS